MSFILPGGLGQIKAGPPPFSAWSVSNVFGGPTYSNNNATLTAGATQQAAVAGTLLQNTGKRYFEVQFTVLGTRTSWYDSVGLVTSAWTASNFNTQGVFGVGAGTNETGIISIGGWTCYLNGSGVSGFSLGPTAGDVVGVAADFSGTLGFYFRLNGNWLNGGTPQAAFPSTPDITWGSIVQLMPAASLMKSGVMTLNTGGAAFANAAPAGFTAWG